MVKVKNIGSAPLTILEFLVKATTLEPGEEMTVSPDTVKITIPNAEVTLT